MISVMVIYKDRPDPGPGFYGLAADYGPLPRNPSAAQRLTFRNDQVKKLYSYYSADGAHPER